MLLFMGLQLFSEMPPQSLASNLNVDANVFSPMSRARLESWKMRNEEASEGLDMNIEPLMMSTMKGGEMKDENMKPLEVKTFQDTPTPYHRKASYDSDTESSKPRSYPAGRRRRSSGFVEYCRFCRNNGEDEAYYMSHVTKDSGGAVKCPVLRNYTCPK